MMKMSEEYDFSKGKRAPVVPVPLGKTRITIRLDDDVLQWFRAQVYAAEGGNYQTLINHALREHIKRSNEPLEEILRRILREEFRRSSSRGTTGGSKGSVATARTLHRKAARR
jgi:uncharacterized protein (DUF4415 family)